MTPILVASLACLGAASASPQRIGGFQSGLSFYGDDDYSQFGDYDSYDPQEDEGETFAFESNFEKNQQQMKEQEKPATSFSLADGFPEDDIVEGQEAEEGVKTEDPSLREFT